MKYRRRFDAKELNVNHARAKVVIVQDDAMLTRERQGTLDNAQMSDHADIRTFPRHRSITWGAGKN